MGTTHVKTECGCWSPFRRSEFDVCLRARNARKNARRTRAFARKSTDQGQPWDHCRHRWGFPCFVRSPCTGMPSPLPRRNRGGLVVRSLHDGGLPQILAGSASTLPFSRPARRSLALRPACSLSRLMRPVWSKAPTISFPPSPLRLLPAGTTVAGRESHPLKMHDFSRRTRICVWASRLWVENLV